MKRQKLEAVLRKHRCFIVRDKGKHTVWKSPTGALATVPRHNEIKEFTAKSIYKALGIDPVE